MRLRSGHTVGGAEGDTEPAKLKMDIDEAYKTVGEYGRLQRRALWLSAFLMVFLAFHQIQNVFVAAEPEFYCVPPHGEPVLGCPSGKLTCDKYDFPGHDFTSIVSEWSLVCGQSYMSSGVQSILMAGLFMGCLLFGNWADTYGRKNLYCLGFASVGILAFLGGFAPWYWMYVCIRFLVGFFCGGAGIVAFVLVSELIGPAQRGFLGMVFPCFFAIGIALYAAIAYCIRDWRALSFITALPALVVIYLYRILPESPRWLLSKGRRHEAEHMLYKMAAMNRRGLPVPEISLIVPDTAAGGRPTGVWDILMHPVLRRRFLINVPIWFVFSAVYYGMTMSAGNLGGDMYVSVALSGLSELPAYLLAIYILDRLGRRVTLSATLCMAGIPCLGILALPTSAAITRIVMGLAGKMSVSVAFSVGYIYVAELFPTSLRNNAIGLCSTAARVGGIVSPLLGPLSQIYPSMEYLIYGSMSLCAGGLALLLPDTTGKTLPETVEDMDKEMS